MPAGDHVPEVTVVVLNYNGKHHLEPCLDSLLQLDYPAGCLELLVCDNDSADGSADFVAERYSQVTLVRLDRNYGFAEGNNRAAARARHPYVAFLNNDMKVDRGWLRELVAPLDATPAPAVVSSKILSWTGDEIDYIG